MALDQRIIKVTACNGPDCEVKHEERVFTEAEMAETIPPDWIAVVNDKKDITNFYHDYNCLLRRCCFTRPTVAREYLDSLQQTAQAKK